MAAAPLDFCSRRAFLPVGVRARGLGVRARGLSSAHVMCVEGPALDFSALDRCDAAFIVYLLGSAALITALILYVLGSAALIVRVGRFHRRPHRVRVRVGRPQGVEGD